MTWLKLDDNFFGDPKIVAAGRDARDLFLAALTYSSRHLTDGRIPAGALARIAADAEVHGELELASRLVEVGLWAQDGEDFVVPKYLKYNPSSEQIKAERDAARRRKVRRSIGSPGVRPEFGRTDARSSASPSIAAADAAALPSRIDPVPSLTAAAPARAESEGLVDGFYEAIGVEPHSLTRTLRKRELSIADQLVEAGADVAEAQRFVGWCRDGPYRPIPSDLRVYEQKRAQFQAHLEPVASGPPGRRSNGQLPGEEFSKGTIA